MCRAVYAGPAHVTESERVIISVQVTQVYAHSWERLQYAVHPSSFEGVCRLHSHARPRVGITAFSSN
jgi:hypothetical protein